jgi:hypothetical protein
VSLKRAPLVNRNRRPSSSTDRITITGDDYGRRLRITICLPHLPSRLACPPAWELSDLAEGPHSHTPILPYFPNPPTPKGGPYL